MHLEECLKEIKRLQSAMIEGEIAYLKECLKLAERNLELTQRLEEKEK